MVLGQVNLSSPKLPYLKVALQHWGLLRLETRFGWVQGLWLRAFDGFGLRGLRPRSMLYKLWAV